MHYVYEDLSNWDVSNVLNMQSLFMYANNFNNNISNWNVSSVTSMAQLFQDAYDFNVYLNGMFLTLQT